MRNTATATSCFSRRPAKNDYANTPFRLPQALYQVFRMLEVDSRVQTALLIVESDLRFIDRNAIRIPSRFLLWIGSVNPVVNGESTAFDREYPVIRHIRKNDKSAKN